MSFPFAIFILVLTLTLSIFLFGITDCNSRILKSNIFWIGLCIFLAPLFYVIPALISYGLSDWGYLHFQIVPYTIEAGEKIYLEPSSTEPRQAQIDVAYMNDQLINLNKVFGQDFTAGDVITILVPNVNKTYGGIYPPQHIRDNTNLWKLKIQ